MKMKMKMMGGGGMGMINKFNLLHISEVDMRGFFLMPW